MYERMITEKQEVKNFFAKKHWVNNYRFLSKLLERSQKNDNTKK